jgi:hypothetical protein
MITTRLRTATPNVCPNGTIFYSKGVVAQVLLSEEVLIALPSAR